MLICAREAITHHKPWPVKLTGVGLRSLVFFKGLSLGFAPVVSLPGVSVAIF